VVATESSFGGGFPMRKIILAFAGPAGGVDETRIALAGQRLANLIEQNLR
jgi:hypothetical protein